jgi:hypothetical protein
VPQQLQDEVQAVSHGGRLLEIDYPVWAKLHNGRKSNFEAQKEGNRFAAPNRSSRLLRSSLNELSCEIQRIRHVSGDWLKLRILISDPQALSVIVFACRRPVGVTEWLSATGRPSRSAPCRRSSPSELLLLGGRSPPDRPPLLFALRVISG